MNPVTKAYILAADPTLLSPEEKRLYLELLYGPEAEDQWKRDLKSVEANRVRWNALLGDAASSRSTATVEHLQLVRRAQLLGPENVETTVTSFCDWVYRLYVRERPNPRKLSVQRSLEKEVVAKRIPALVHSKWKCIYNGTGGGQGEVFSIPALRLEGEPLRGKPDLVFREKGSGRLLIVELKISDHVLPSDGWPNLRAQLWAYSKIDHRYWRDAPEIILAAEVWKRATRLQRSGTRYWKASDPILNARCEQLFEIFRAHCEGRS